MSQQNFQVDLKGMISLLSDHLYSGPEIYIRELLQNGIDSITARQSHEPNHVGALKLEIISSEADHVQTLVACDNGIGLTEDEVHQFLATIGKSSKRENLSSDDFLGQFGIGLLSGFVVCEEIVIVTQSIQSDASAIEWRGRSDGTYEVRSLNKRLEPGTQVYLRAKPGCNDFFATDFVEKKARDFGKHLPVAIEILANGTCTQINEVAPWQDEFFEAPAKDNTAKDNTAERLSEEQRRADLLAYGKETFEIDFLDAIPLQSESGGVEGVAYILPFAASQSSKKTSRVYLKNMLLSEKIDNLLPEWAFFVKCVINTKSLRPTAARESFYENEELKETQRALGDCLREYLVNLAEENRERLDEIIELHRLAIKSLAVDDDQFFKMFIDWIPFETSLGNMTLGDYCKENPKIKFVPTRDQFRQISGVASAHSLSIINCGYVYDMELMERIPILFPEREIELVDISKFVENFEDLDLNEREQVFELMKIADAALQPYRCQAEVKKFHPTELPTLYTASGDSQFYRSTEKTKEVADELWGGVLENVVNFQPEEAYSHLCLNFRNTLVQKLAQVKNREMVQKSIEMLYVQSLLLGHYPLNSNELHLLSDGLLGMIDFCLDTQSSDTQDSDTQGDQEK